LKLIQGVTATQVQACVRGQQARSPPKLRQADNMAMAGGGGAAGRGTVAGCDSGGGSGSSSDGGSSSEEDEEDEGGAGAGGGVSRSSLSAGDVRQGALGDCYLLSATACLAQAQPAVAATLIDAAFEDEGVYGVVLCVAGRWRMVYVDAFFPCCLHHDTHGGGGGGGGWLPCYAGTSACGEVWPMVVEKAFAKLLGCYEALNVGNLADSLSYMTGGVQSTLYLKQQLHEDADEVWERLEQIHSNANGNGEGALVGAGSNPEGAGNSAT
jgi:hypothetical protein